MSRPSCLTKQSGLDKMEHIFEGIARRKSDEDKGDFMQDVR
jgi:hypothetical protein